MCDCIVHLKNKMQTKTLRTPNTVFFYKNARLKIGQNLRTYYEHTRG